MFKKLNYQKENMVYPEISFKDMDNNHINSIKKGYVATLNSIDTSVLFAFKNVDPHIDGNGISTLWLMSGEGVFHHPEADIKMKSGDIFLFDDHVEHGFSSQKLCLGLSITWEKIPSLDEIKDKIDEFITSQNNNINLKNQKKMVSRPKM